MLGKILLWLLIIALPLVALVGYSTPPVDWQKSYTLPVVAKPVWRVQIVGGTVKIEDVGGFYAERLK